MQLVLLTFVIGVLNLFLGYTVAVFLGVGPTRPWGDRKSPRPALPASMPHGEHAQTGGERVREEGRCGQAGSPPETPAPGTSAESSEAASEKGPITLDTFRRFVAMSASSLADFATRLKKSSRGDHTRTPWTFVAELQGICQPYLEKLTQVAERLSDQIGDEVQGLVLEQAAQLETTLNNLQYMNFDSGVLAAMGRVSQEAANTLAMAHALQKAMQPPPGATGVARAE